MSAIGSLIELPMSIANYNHNLHKDNWSMDFAESERDYAHEQDNIRMEREDTAMQRQAADAAAVGVNPLSLNGNGAQSSGATVSSPPSLNSSNDTLGLAQGFASIVNDLEQMKNGTAQRDLLDSQKGLIDAQKQFQTLENNAHASRLKAELAESSSRTKLSDSQRDQIGFLNSYQKELNRQLMSYAESGLNVNMSTAERAYTTLLRDRDNHKNFGYSQGDDFEYALGKVLGMSGSQVFGSDLYGLLNFFSTVGESLSKKGFRSSASGKGKPSVFDLF